MSVSRGILPWHDTAWQLLKGYISNERIPQALLLTGQAGLGKTQLVRFFVHLLLCESRDRSHDSPCGKCRPCTLFLSGTHPDFVEIKPESDDKDIGIDQIRWLLSKIRLTVHYLQYRVIVVQQADQMNRSAANSFLKVLEEPPDRTVIILITDQLSLIPATVQSRCQKIAIEPPTAGSALDWLNENYITGDLPLLLKLSGGAPLLAREYAERDAITIRAQLFEKFLLLRSKKLSIVTVAAFCCEHNQFDLVAWMISLIVDLMKINKTSSMTGVMNVDLYDSLKMLTGDLDLQRLYDFYLVALELRIQLKQSINKNLAYEGFFIKWMAV
ncbi:MAG TPA: DNA polymerase III subunit delta' [Methylococcaceae bacterium]|jgi:DNA polymerase-3 subunit delta'|nr:DNA polymerase III subunit delta' [Methylococcaceae bacterium]HIN69011.1 DNA polymerase III subunit delta' [Methylococcales bacterium]HIA44913.1 DNA polymerase III subunit delta' [Methylococcaceae bacterium]HIB63400.1 DNA polymerase III subunit delta' [Methylococcaceae bacterium]HIO13195.1 DNA polymerase III subunit delta' [Methylococcales bacterium]